MCGVRIATEEDAGAVAALYAPYVLDTAISFEERAPSPDEMRSRMRNILPRYPFLVFETAEDLMGFAYASPHAERTAYRWSVDVAVYVASRAHRKGIGRALYLSLFDILRRQGVHAVFAGITLPNENSVGLHEAMGLMPIGVYREVGYKLGAWRDVGWWGGVIGSDSLPGEVTAFAALSARS